MDYDLALKRKEIRMHAVAWMNHEDMLNDMNHTKGQMTYFSTYVRYPEQS